MKKMKHFKGKVNPKYIIHEDGIAYAPLNIVVRVFDLDIISIRLYVERLLEANHELFAYIFRRINDEWYMNWIGALIVSLLKDGEVYTKRRNNLITSLVDSKPKELDSLRSLVQPMLREAARLSGFQTDACRILENAFFIGYYGLKREEVVELASNAFKLNQIDEVFPYFLPIKTTTKLYHFYLEGIEFLDKRLNKYNNPATEPEFFNVCYDMARAMRKLHCEWFPEEAPEIKYN